MQTDQDGLVAVERRGEVLHIQFNRPAKRNALTPGMIADYSRALAMLDRDDALRCALVTAAGEHFTAGLDLVEAADLWNAGGTLYPADLPHICDIRAPFRRKPLVMAVQGITFTFGVELMLAADIVVAAQDCRFAVLEVTRGIMASAGATVRLPAIAGWSNAMRWLLTGDEFDSAQACRMNIVQHVVPVGEQVALAEQIAQRIAKRAAPLAVLATRENAALALREGHAAAVACFDDIRTRLRSTADASEGLASFRERRAARFVGR